MTLFYLTMAFVVLLIVVVELLMPDFVRPTLPFGVRIPEAKAGDERIARERRDYRIRVLLGSLIVVVATFALAIALDQPLISSGGLLVLLLVFWAVYYRAHRRLRALKAREGWYEGRRQGVAVETSLRTEPTRMPWLWALPSVALVLLTAAIGIWKYPSLPDTLVIHWGADGQPDGWATTSVWSAFSLVFVQVGLTLLLLVLGWLIPRFRQELDVEHPETSARQRRVYQRDMAKGLLFMAACINVTMLFGSLQIWDILPANNGSLALAVIIPTLVGTLGLVVISLRLGQGGFRTRAGTEDSAGSGYLNRDDDRYWLGGIFYVNRDDPALFVDKRYGIGWTLNFGHRGAWLLLICLIAVAVLAPLLSILAGQ